MNVLGYIKRGRSEYTKLSTVRRYMDNVTFARLQSQRVVFPFGSLAKIINAIKRHFYQIL